MAISDIKEDQSDKKPNENKRQAQKKISTENTNNFVCYEKLKLMVSEPYKYLLVHIAILVGMIYFYFLTFFTQSAVKQINYAIIPLHFLVFVFNVILGFKNPGICLKISQEFQTQTKINIPFDKHCKPGLNEADKSYVFGIKSHFINVRFCSECLIFKPPRTVHCWTCNACVQGMDHHCPFIGNCVGKGNYPYFIGYVISLKIMLLLILSQLIIMIINLVVVEGQNIYRRAELYFSILLVLFCLAVLCFVFSLAVFHYYMIFNNLTTNQLCKQTWNTSSGNPFKKNLCTKNIIRFIKGPGNRHNKITIEQLQKIVIPRSNEKSQQYLSSSEGILCQQAVQQAQTEKKQKKAAVESKITAIDQFDKLQKKEEAQSNRKLSQTQNNHTNI